MQTKTCARFFITLFLLTLMGNIEAQFNFYISNSGSDHYPGNIKLMPRQTIEGSASLLSQQSASEKRVSVGLRQGDLFEESLSPTYPIEVGTYKDNKSPDGFATMTGSTEFSDGWTVLPGSQNTFSQKIPLTGFSGTDNIGSYSYIYVTEIDKSLEHLFPFTARKVLQFVKSIEAVEKTPGSFFSPIGSTENPVMMYLQTSDGSSPNRNTRYRYEVTTRYCAINSYFQPDNVFENLWVRGFGAGVGSLPGGQNSFYNRIVFGPGTGIHHLVTRGGAINNSLFLPGAKNTSDFAVVFYDVEGSGRHCTIKNSIFMDISAPLYAHTSLGTNFGAVEMDNIIGFADKSVTSGFMFTSNNDTVILKNIYAEDYLCGYNYGSAKYASIESSYFKDVQFGIAYSWKNPVVSKVNNVFIKTKSSKYTAGIYLQNNTNLTLTNSIVHLSNSYANYWADAGTFIGCGNDSRVAASGNVFICDIIPTATAFATTLAIDSNGTPSGNWDNNVYILLKGNKIAWRINKLGANRSSTIAYSFDEWRKQTGQDKNSLFLDLRNDPRGLKAIFQDPENGNYELADTKEGRQVADLHAGMYDPITCFLKKPSYEEAAKIIYSGKPLSVNSCRSPCKQNKIRVTNTTSVNELVGHNVEVAWTIEEQQNIARYEVERATGNSNFKKIASLPVSGDAINVFTEHVQPGVKYQYRLAVFANGGGVCYSDAKAIEIHSEKPVIVYPNPSKGKFSISMNGYVGNATITVANAAGQTVLNNSVISLYNPIVLDMDNQPRGIYFIKIARADGTFVEKVVLN